MDAIFLQIPTFFTVQQELKSTFANTGHYKTSLSNNLVLALFLAGSGVDMSNGVDTKSGDWCMNEWKWLKDAHKMALSG